MSNLSRKMRSKKASSTDPEWLEKMAAYYDTPMETFDTWLFELEHHGLRYERMMAEVGNNPLTSLEWLKQAYQLGYERGKYGQIPN